MQYNQWCAIYCLLNNYPKRLEIISELPDYYLFDDLAKSVYKYLVDLSNDNITYDKSLLHSRFSSQYKEIVDNLEHPLVKETNVDNYREYIKNLREDYIEFEARAFANYINHCGKVNEHDLLLSMDDMYSKISGSSKSSLLEAHLIAQQVAHDLEQPPREQGLISWGVEELNERFIEIEPSDYIVIAGRPSMGKSGLAGWIACSNALAGNPTAIFSLEMSAKQYMRRMFAGVCDIELWKFKNKKLRTPEEISRLKIVQESLADMPMIIDDTANLNIAKMRTIIQKIKLKYPGLSLVVVDYLQLMDGEGKDNNSKLGEISKGLKNIAKQFNVRVIACSQLSRLCEMREDNKRPILSDLRDSGTIEQDADIVAMVYRDHYYNYNPKHERICEIIIRKFRNGEIGKITLDYNLKTQSFKSIKPNTQLYKVAEHFQYL